MQQTISLDAVVGFLARTTLFEALDPAERAEVVRVMEVQPLADGDDVFHEGDAGDAWYVIFEGRARVLKDADGGSWEIRVLEPGAAFGEMAILDGNPRSATVQAVGPLTLFRFRRARFEQLLDQGSLGAYKLVLAMARELSQHHRELTQRLAEASTSRAAAAEYQISE